MPGTRRISVLILFVTLVLTALSAYGTAQSVSRRPPTPYQAALRSLIEGRYDELDASVDKLDLRDPNVVALKARGLIARGRYADAETLLRPVAQRAPQSEAALELGLLEHMLTRPEGAVTLGKVATLADTSVDAREVGRAARALRALGRFQEANAAYREAASEMGGDAGIQTAWGDLFLEKYNKPEAMRSYQMAMQYDSRWLPAMMGSARALADDNPPQAVALAKRVLEVDPSSVDAHLFLAEQAVDASKLDEAKQEIKKALTTNPNSLDAHALAAGVAFNEDKQPDFDAEVAKTHAIAPKYSDVYRIAGEITAHNYRFDEAVTLTRRALALAPEDPKTLADLGLQLLRTGDEAGARTALDASFKLDGYDVVTLNLLTMLDGLEKFVVVRDGDVVMKMHKDEAPVLQEYAMPLAQQALKTLSAKYQFTPKGPILVEIFPKHDDFAVRTLGLPGMIGALGVCFGRVVTMDSPRARPGEFQWEATLWHELAHVITLQMSNQRLPRWLSEGISVYEETQHREDWGREMEMEFASMLNRGEVLKLKDLNAAFQNPKTISLAYFQASLLVEHIVSAFGEPALRKLVLAFAKGGENGGDTEAAFRAALNTDFDQMQAGFDQTIERKFGAMKRAMAVPDGVDDLLKTPTATLKTIAADNPRSYPVQVALGRALRRDGQLDEAAQAFERAAALVPVARGKGSPNDELAAIALQKKDQARAIASLTALVRNDFNNVDAARQLAGLLRESNVTDAATLMPIYERIASIDPFDADAHASLGRMALQRNDADAAAREFRTVLALNPVDRAAAHTDLAESYFKSGKKAEAKKQTLAALEIAPSYERAQELLLKLVDPR
jgi:tetratricopeptide (TPR) repeat protein